MASGKKSAPLSSLAAYGESEPDSDSDSDASESRGACLVYGYGEDDLSKTEDAGEKTFAEEESGGSISEMEESDEGRDANDVEVTEAETRDPRELVEEGDSRH
uniref:Uncharacterized protein n=1 Tax=Knipowitschia caucasica TaxID=637954 RepID=A0AAV2MT12_KNICA